MHREPIDFAKEDLIDKLLQLPHNGPVVFVLEGVVIYLSESDIQNLLGELDYKFPKHRLMCDLVNREMVDKYGQTLSQVVTETGTPFQSIDHP